MSRWGCCAASLTAALALALPAGASADTTIGNVTQPSGSKANACPTPSPNSLLTGSAVDAGPEPAVPSSSVPQSLTHWQLNVDGATAGAKVTLVVLRFDSAAETVEIVGTDTETLTPGTLPSGNIEDFTLANPIAVQGGDVLALDVAGPDAPGIACDWSQGSISENDEVDEYALASPPSVGGQLAETDLGNPTAVVVPADLNLGATIAPRSYDAALTLSADTVKPVAGQPAVLSATVTNNSRVPGPITFIDPVPVGVPIVAASAGAGAGTCTVGAGNVVTCSFPSIEGGQSATVVIVLRPTTAQTFADAGAVAVASGTSDPNPGNNIAAVALQVSPPAVSGPTKCVVPKLGRTSVSLAKRLLALLGCQVGKATGVHSKTVAKGLVIGTSPGAGTYSAGRKIALKVSSGPLKKPSRHKKGRR